MRLVITGATGNVGTSLIERLTDRSEVEEIAGVARRLPDRPFPRTRFFAADVGESDLDPLLEGADVVVHLAWRLQPTRRPQDLQRTNIEGSRRLFEAAARAGVPKIVYASSVAAYSPAPGREPVDESHPTDGVEGSLYSTQKARVERILDGFEKKHPEIQVVRMRPGFIFKREAAWGIRRNFLGPFLPRPLLGADETPAIPACPGLRANAVHSTDVGEAFALAILSEVGGAFNLAAEPVLDAALVAERLRAREVNVSCGVLRAGLAALYHLRLEPMEPGWMELGHKSPLMQVRRARDELGWEPRIRADDALLELVDGLRHGDSLDTPPLRPQWNRALEDLFGMKEAERKEATTPAGGG